MGAVETNIPAVVIGTAREATYLGSDDSDTGLIARNIFYFPTPCLLTIRRVEEEQVSGTGEFGIGFFVKDFNKL